MGLFDLLKSKTKQDEVNNSPIKIGTGNSSYSGKAGYADARSVSEDERPYYRPDDYYTTYSYPGTEMARRVITFDERKKTSYSSLRSISLSVPSPGIRII